MTVAVIDIGTNTVLLLVAQIDGRGRISPLVYEQRVPRLGAGVDEGRTLRREAIDRVIAVLQEYKLRMSTYAPEVVVVCGTSAVRDATNAAELASRIRQATGFSLEVLTGDQEALWTYRGAISGIPGIIRATAVDIGGGSTEISVGDRSAVMKSVSLDIGSVRLTERILKHDPPTGEELEQAVRLVKRELGRLTDFPFSGTTLVGVAGTATSLAVLAQGLRAFELSAVTNYRLERTVVESLFQKLSRLPAAEIREMSSIMEGRADVITAGVLILREVMRYCAAGDIIVSERGVRYGLALREWEATSRAG